MLTPRPGRERGHANHGWLDSFFSFSFADYRDPAHMGFRSLRVLNDDRIAGEGGFGAHPHRDMEILTHVLSGTLAHRDSMGNGSAIKAGEWQYMSAGRGVTHSEMNPTSDGVHLLQIWILPDQRGYEPRYDQKLFPENPGAWTLAASPDGRDGSIAVRQDVLLSAAKFTKGQSLKYAFAPGRFGYLHIATGSATVNGHAMAAGDALKIEKETEIEMLGGDAGEVLLFDLL